MATIFKKEHKCLQTRDINLAIIWWISYEIEPLVIASPEIKTGALVDILQKKHQIQITRHQMFRAKQQVVKRIQGDCKEQFRLLRDYAEELIRSNPGTIVKIDVETEPNPSSPTRQFRRIYICLGDLKRGFNMAGGIY